MWPVPGRAGPIDRGASSAVWLYHSHVDETGDVMAGLIGPIVVTRRGVATDDGKPNDVDREVFAFFQIFDEHESRLWVRNLEAYLPGYNYNDFIPGWDQSQRTPGVMNMGTDELNMGDMNAGGDEDSDGNMPMGSVTGAASTGTTGGTMGSMRQMPDGTMATGGEMNVTIETDDMMDMMDTDDVW